MDTEDCSGYTITDADKRFAQDLGFVAPEVLPLHVARFRTRVLEDDRKQRQPASPPDRLPVPGAAVRAQCTNWLNDPSEDVRVFGRILEAALRADAAAAATLPTREELAVMLASDAEPGADPREQWLHAADVALAVLARRPATDEAEALPRPDRKEIAHALILTFQKASKELRAPDYEAPWFAVADEAIKLCAPGVAGDPLWKRVEGLHAERNALHAQVHACERAIRDLETLERVRANANIGWWVNDLRRSLDSGGKRSEYHALLADLCALLSPDDAGRGEAGGSDD